MRKINYIIIEVALVLLAMFAIPSCTTDDLDPTLDYEKELDKAIVNVDNVKNLLYGAYSRMTASGYYGRDMIINCEVRTDNCYANGKSGRFTTASELKYNSNTGFMWNDAYSVIQSANLIINVDLSKLKGDKAWAKNLQGQAYIIRALAHFDLLAMYGQQHVGGDLGVPCMTKVTTKDSPEADFQPKRNTVSEVRKLVFSDLDKAYSLMSASDAIEFDNVSDKEVFSRYAAKALEARIALYFKMWDKAAAAAKVVIDSEEYKIVGADEFIGSWYKKRNANSIFELAFNATDNRGINGLAYIYRRPLGSSPSTGYGDVSAFDKVAQIYSDKDVRLKCLSKQKTKKVVRTINLVKYPNMQGEDNVPLIRIEEVVLTYAEALFEQGKTAEALVELNKIATNRGLEAYTAIDKNLILDERHRELIFEGFRFNDLVRNGMGIYSSGTIGDNMTAVPYGDYRLAWPIPQHEMDANANMVQNKGY